MQPLKDRLAASHDEATLAKAPRVASRDFRNATESSEKEFSLGGVSCYEPGSAIVRTFSMERRHLEVGVNYLLAHNCKHAKLVDNRAFRQCKT